MTAPYRDWRHYQEETAQFFRNLGCSAEVEALVQNVGSALANGTSPQAIVQELVNNGMPQADAKALVANVGQHVKAGSGGGGGRGVSGWLIFIGVILVLNLLSYVFHWGWTFW